MLHPSARITIKRKPNHLTISEARTILLGKVLTYSYIKDAIGHYFLVEEVKKIGRNFIVNGTGCGLHYEIPLTAIDIIALSKFRQFEITIDGKFTKYILC